MADPIILPDPTRERLRQARIDAVQANATIERYDALIVTILEISGLDTSVRHDIDFEKGIITPAPSPMKPEIVKDEAAS